MEGKLLCGATVRETGTLCFGDFSVELTTQMYGVFHKIKTKNELRMKRNIY
jgi:hypothetical protein